MCSSTAIERHNVFSKLLWRTFFGHWTSSMDQMIAGVIRKSNSTGSFFERRDIKLTESKLSFLWPPAPHHPPPSDLWPVDGWLISRGSWLMGFYFAWHFAWVWNQIKQKVGEMHPVHWLISWVRHEQINCKCEIALWEKLRFCFSYFILFLFFI